MPRNPKGQKSNAGVISSPVKVMRAATAGLRGYRAIRHSEGKDPAAVTLGRKGGKARALAMSAKRRKEIARKAAKVRWKI